MCAITAVPVRRRSARSSAARVDAEWNQCADLHLTPVASAVGQCLADDVQRPTNAFGRCADSELNAVRERRRGGERPRASAGDLDGDGRVVLPRQPRQ